MQDATLTATNTRDLGQQHYLVIEQSAYLVEDADSRAWPDDWLPATIIAGEQTVYARVCKFATVRASGSVHSDREYEANAPRPDMPFDGVRVGETRTLWHNHAAILTAALAADVVFGRSMACKCEIQPQAQQRYKGRGSTLVYEIPNALAEQARELRRLAAQRLNRSLDNAFFDGQPPAENNVHRDNGRLTEFEMWRCGSLSDLMARVRHHYVNSRYSSEEYHQDRRTLQEMYFRGTEFTNDLENRRMLTPLSTDEAVDRFFIRMLPPEWRLVRANQRDGAIELTSLQSPSLDILAATDSHEAYWRSERITFRPYHNPHNGNDYEIALSLAHKVLHWRLVERDRHSLNVEDRLAARRWGEAYLGGWDSAEVSESDSREQFDLPSRVRRSVVACDAVDNYINQHL